METDRYERKNRICRMNKEGCEEGGWMTNSGGEIPGGGDMDVKEDYRTAERGSGSSASGKGCRRDIPG